MAAILDYKCPNCGGSIKFNSTDQQFKCESCDSVFTQEQLDVYAQMLNSAQAQSTDFEQHEGETLEGMNSYSCQSCGAQIVADENTAASACPYCGSPVVLSGRLSGMNKPDFVIPFKLDKSAATAALKGFYKGKFLLPKVFKDENKIREMKGVYVPFWMFDCDANASIFYDAVKIRSWSDANYNYTETKHFNVLRSGTLGFANVLVDGSSKMDDAYMEGIEPFNFTDLTAFDPAYLSGFYADKYDVDSQASFPRAQSRIETSTADAFAATVQGYAGVVPKNTNISTQNVKCHYSLLPVWMFTTKYRDKIYQFAINGQTGRISGELPVDKKKFWLLFGGIAAAVIALGQFFIL